MAGRLGAHLNAMFASDIGHWDVPDVRGVLPEAWELVEDGRLTEEDFAEMRDILTKMETELNDGDPIQLSHLDTAFHDVIYRASRHRRLYRAWT